MRKNVFGIVLILAIVFAFALPVRAQVPQGDVAYFDLHIEYIGPVVMYPEGKERAVTLGLYSLDSGLIQEVLMEKTDDCHFRCDLPNIQNGSYFFQVTDVARYDGKDESSTIVGDVLLVTVKQTNKTKQLKDIRLHSAEFSFSPGLKAKIAFFKLTMIGDVISEPLPIIPTPKK